MTDATQQRSNLQSSHAVAELTGALFLCLGGSLIIDHTGRRSRIIPEAPEAIPQLPDPRPHEVFHSSEEWAGAMKLVDYLLTRLHPVDQAFVWDAFAEAVVERRAEQ